MRTKKTKLGVDIKSTAGMRAQAPTRLWVLIVNNARAQIYEMKNGHDQAIKVRDIEHPAGRSSGHSLVSDKPGRTFQSHTQAHGGHQTGAVRHSFSSEEDPKTHESQAWAGTLARMLEDTISEYDRLVLVAEPHLAGRLNAHLTAAVRHRIERTVEKDWGWLPVKELHARLAEIVSKSE